MTESTRFIIQGTGVVPGYAYAPVIWATARPTLPTGEYLVPEDRRDAEVARFDAAASAVAAGLSARAGTATGAAREVLEATASLARDRAWLRAVAALVRTGRSAEAATSAATEEFVTRFQKAGGLIAERATDLWDIRDRVVAELLGRPAPGIPNPETAAVLLAEDLAPTDTAGLNPATIAALVTRQGGPTSHTAVLARELGLPCVVAAPELDRIAEGTPVLVDGARGLIEVGADPDEARARVDADVRRRAAVRGWRGPARTADGTRVHLLANVQDAASARKAAETPAEGIGLFRTELSFLSAVTEPSVDEQASLYAGVFAAFPHGEVVVRTLDAGSDKPVPFANHETEENPALGVRGLRLDRINPGLLSRQLDAIAEAARRVGFERPRVMAPMVSTVDEAREFAALARARLLIPGIMVEVPAVTVLADAFLAEVDFFSIGTNDLTQYTLAVDRTSAPLALLSDPWQPAVLRLVALTCEAGQRAGKPVGVCGEAAADPLLAGILLGLGVTSLSMAATAIPRVGVALGGVTLERCRAAARAVLATTTALEAKSRAADLLG